MWNEGDEQHGTDEGQKFGEYVVGATDGTCEVKSEGAVVLVTADDVRRDGGDVDSEHEGDQLVVVLVIEQFHFVAGERRDNELQQRGSEGDDDEGEGCDLRGGATAEAEGGAKAGSIERPDRVASAEADTFIPLVAEVVDAAGGRFCEARRLLLQRGSLSH